ncbi:MAG: hypothetical protein ABIR26_10395, partial [Ramlibacter sp.]
MTPEQHIQKAARVLASLRKLSADDYEMTLEAAMLAGTHLMNAVLHRRSITGAGDDVMHAEYMTMALRTRVQLEVPGLVESLDAIEQARPYFVRGGVAQG